MDSKALSKGHRYYTGIITAYQSIRFPFHFIVSFLNTIYSWMQTFVILTFGILLSRCQNPDWKLKRSGLFFFRSEKSFFFFLLLKHFYHRIVPYFVLFFRQRCLFDLEISAELGSLGGERQLSPDERTALLEVATLTKVKVRFSADASRVRSGSAAQDNRLLIETNTIKASGLE